MSSPFNEGAVERIAQSCWHSRVDTLSLWRDILPGYASGSFSFDSYLQNPISWGHADEPLSASQIHRFAELLEIGISCGYVSLDELRADLLRPALIRFLHDPSIPLNFIDTTLTVQLLSRLDAGPAARVDTSEAFYAYGAYLALEDRIRKDYSFSVFSETSSSNWRPFNDLPFLISPRHFAEAICTGHIGPKPYPHALGGFRAIEYFGALFEIYLRLRKRREETDASLVEDYLSPFEQEPTFEKILRHSTWTHRCQDYEARLELWQERTAEWEDESETVTGTPIFLSQSALNRAIPAIKRALQQLELLKSPSLQAPTRQRISVSELVREGRVARAIKQLTDDLNLLEESVRHVRAPDWKNAISQYVDTALSLAELGAIDRSATYLAGIEDDLVGEQSHIPAAIRMRALDVLGGARRGALADIKGHPKADGISSWQLSRNADEDSSVPRLPPPKS